MPIGLKENGRKPSRPNSLSGLKRENNILDLLYSNWPYKIFKKFLANPRKVRNIKPSRIPRDLVLDKLLEKIISLSLHNFLIRTPNIINLKTCYFIFPPLDDCLCVKELGIFITKLTHFSLDFWNQSISSYARTSLYWIVKSTCARNFVKQRMNS